MRGNAEGVNDNAGKKDENVECVSSTTDTRKWGLRYLQHYSGEVLSFEDWLKRGDWLRMF